ncbi:MAG: twin-arginine translocase subunit TatC, partial [Thiotrichaceae bacterium]|nr:twin-arginine translocase subunit TatC [Thiotrichaceae bacterium]
MSKADTKNTAVATGFLSHLIELRDRLLRAVIAVGIFFIVLFPFASDIYDWLAAPLGQGMIIIGPVAPFLIPMKLTLMVAFLIALPYLLFQLWSFVAPGLYKHEKRLVYPLLASSVFLFYLGIMFVYFVLLPMMFKIIPSFVPQTAEFKPDIAQYLDFVVMMFMAFGIGFEMPIATILLITTGMTTAEKLKQKRPYVIVGAFVVGMLLTPPDVVSQIMLAIPMWLLFELGIIASKFFKVRVKEAGEAKEAREKADNDAQDAKATAATSAAYLPPDDLWSEDDIYTYEEDDGSPDDDVAGNLSDEERSILGNDPLEDDINDDEYLPEDDDAEESEDTFFDGDNDDFEELSDDEMDAELDRIEAQEKAEKAVKKKAKKRAK